MTDYQMQVRGHFANAIQWSWAWDITSNDSPSVLTTKAVNALTDFWNNGTYGVGTVYPTSTVMDSVNIITLDATYRHQAKSVGSLALAGASSDNAMAISDSMVIHKQSPGLQRHQRGFTRMPAPVEGVLVNELYTPTVVTRFGNAARALFTAMTAGGATVFVHLGKTAAKDGSPPYSKTVITAVQASNKPGTIRARSRRVVAVLG